MNETNKRSIGKAVWMRAFVAAVTIYILICGIPFLGAATTEATASMTMSVQIKERLILRVRSGGQLHEDSGDSQANVTTQFRMEDNPVHVEVWSRVAQNRGVQLQVQLIRDNRPLQVKESDLIAWQASGAGFFEGTLKNNQPQTMGAWIGPGRREGTIRFYYTTPGYRPSEDETYTIHYSLYAL